MQHRFSPSPLPGSERTPIEGAKYGTPPQQRIRVTVYMDDSAAPEDYDLVAEFAHAHHLSVPSSDRERKTISLMGAIADMQEAFETNLEHVNDPATGKQIRVRQGTISIPEALQGKVIAVLGLDNRPVARPRFRLRPDEFAYPENQPKVSALPVLDILDAYNFPKNATGKCQCIAILELGGGYDPSDLSEFWAAIGMNPPTVTDISVLGGFNDPSDDASIEVVLDIEIASAAAPDADIAVYFAPNTDQGFVEALLDIHMDQKRKPRILSISWGGAEDTWTPMALGAMNSALYRLARSGVSIFAAAGDNLSSDGESSGNYVDYPAASEYVTAVGGTRLVLNKDNTIYSETVWNDHNGSGTGGGVSRNFAIPGYQKKFDIPSPPNGFAGRGVPDIAVNGDPVTGYQIFYSGGPTVVGGTSCGAPLLAGLAARIQELRGGNAVGLYNSYLYRVDAETFRDVKSGNNGGYKAAAGWDACSGLGSIDGAKLAGALPFKSQPKAAPAPAAKPSDGPIPNPPPGDPPKREVEATEPAA